MSTIDLSKLECPLPVIQTKKHLEENPDTSIISVIVDNKAASENVSRFLTHQGFSLEVSEKENAYTIIGKKNGTARMPAEGETEKPGKTTLILFSHNVIGTGEPELGSKLMLNFIKTLSEMKDSLWRLVFVNEGVKLTIKGAETLPVLQQLEEDGISILVCGTCLEYFNILDQKMTGETTNMLDIITSLQVSDKVINL